MRLQRRFLERAGHTVTIVAPRDARPRARAAAPDAGVPRPALDPDHARPRVLAARGRAAAPIGSSTPRMRGAPAGRRRARAGRLLGRVHRAPVRRAPRPAGRAHDAQPRRRRHRGDRAVPAARAARAERLAAAGAAAAPAEPTPAGPRRLVVPAALRRRCRMPSPRRRRTSRAGSRSTAWWPADGVAGDRRVGTASTTTCWTPRSRRRRRARARAAAVRLARAHEPREAAAARSSRRSRESGIDADVEVIGGGGQRAPRAGSSRSSGPTASVVFAGRMPYAETLRRIAAADAVVQTSIGFETQGMTVFEAASLGTPVGRERPRHRAPSWARAAGRSRMARSRRSPTTLRRAAADIEAGTAPVPDPSIRERFRQSSRTAAMVEVYDRVTALSPAFAARDHPSLARSTPCTRRCGVYSRTAGDLAQRRADAQGRRVQSVGIRRKPSFGGRRSSRTMRDGGEGCEKNHHEHGRNATLDVILPRVAGWTRIARKLPSLSHALSRTSRSRMKTVAVIVQDGFAPFEFGVACEAFGLDRSDDGIPNFDFRIVTPEPGRRAVQARLLAQRRERPGVRVRGRPRGGLADAAASGGGAPTRACSTSSATRPRAARGC